MDYQNRVGSKKGSGGVAGTAETNQYRRERVRNLLQSKINIEADPYVFKNHLGLLECRLCLTTHLSESSYITHTTGRRHQLNLLKRANNEKNKQNKKNGINGEDGNNEEEVIEKRYWKSIGKPEKYKIVKIKDPETSNLGLLINIKFDKIKTNTEPLFRFISSSKQTKEVPDPNFQYLVVSAEPYENIAIKIPGNPIDLSKDRIWDYWDQDTKEFVMQFFYLKKNI